MKRGLILKIAMIGSAFSLSSFAFAASLIHDITADLPKSSQSRTQSFIGSGISSPDSLTYMLTLRCRVDAARSMRSRIAVFRTDLNNGKDYAIVSGHAVPENLADCLVQDFAGNQQIVDGFVLSQNYAAGTRTDWGLIRFDAMPTSGLVRYQLPHIAWEQIKTATVPARFAYARGLKDHSQNCQILPSAYKVLHGAQFDGVMPHNCRAIPGQSGSPLSLGGGRDDVLLGIHLGRTWMLQSPVTGRPEFQGFVRVIDSAMITEINALMEQLP